MWKNDIVEAAWILPPEGTHLYDEWWSMKNKGEGSIASQKFCKDFANENWFLKSMICFLSE